MSLFGEYLGADAVQLGGDHPNRKKTLAAVAELLGAGHSDPPVETIFKGLLEREKLGGTGLGKGVALPHCRIAGVGTPRTALLRLDQAIDYDAPDGAAVDLFCALILDENAEGQHLQILSSLARSLSSAARMERLRDTQDPAEVAALLREDPAT